jgi:hypothetical protein
MNSSRIRRCSSSQNTVNIAWESFGDFVDAVCGLLSRAGKPTVFPKRRKIFHGTTLAQTPVIIERRDFSTNPQRSSQQQGSLFLFSIQYQTAFESCCEFVDESFASYWRYYWRRGVAAAESPANSHFHIFSVLCTLYHWRKNEYSTLAVLLNGETDDRNWHRPRGFTTDGI